MKVSPADARVHRGRVPTWNYLHRVEYNLVHDDGHRTHEYSELADDQGWLFRHSEMQRDEYLAYYTRACANDFLERVHAAAGTTWIVAVYRLTDSGDRKPVCSIRFKFATVPARRGGR